MEHPRAFCHEDSLIINDLHSVINSQRKTMEYLKRELDDARVKIESMRNRPASLQKADNVITELRKKLAEATGTTQYRPSIPYDHLKHDLDKANDEIKQLRDLLQFDPGGSNKIDELEQSQQFTKHELEQSKLEIKRLSDIVDEYDNLRSTIYECLPVYVLDDGTGEDANAQEIVEYAGYELNQLRSKLREVVSHFKVNTRWPCIECDRPNAESPLRIREVITEDGNRYRSGCLLCNSDKLLASIEELLKG